MPGRRQASADVGHAGGSEIELEPMLGAKGGPQQLLALADTTTRNGFVRKVYSLLGVQLLVTMLVGGMIVRHGREWLTSNPSGMLAVVTISSFMSLAIAFIFACCPDTMRKTPQNYALMAAFTLAEGVMVGFRVPSVHARFRAALLWPHRNGGPWTYSLCNAKQE